MDTVKRAKWRLLQSNGLNKSWAEVTTDSNTAITDTITTIGDTNASAATTDVDPSIPDTESDTGTHTERQFDSTKNAKILKTSDDNKGEAIDRVSRGRSSFEGEEHLMSSPASKDSTRTIARLSRPLKTANDTSNKMTRTSLTSLFVGSLSSKSGRKKVKNRLGQRARQKLEHICNLHIRKEHAASQMKDPRPGEGD